MRRRNAKCPDGCKLPPRRRTIIKDDNNTFGFGYKDFNFCPVCGHLMPQSEQRLKEFFKLYNVHPDLKPALRLLFKSEYVSAAREAFVTVEESLRKKSGLDLHGSDLATKALAFKYNNSTDSIEEKPLIEISDLSTESKRNEQNGLKFLLMGFFTGQRNLYQHNSIRSGFSNVMSVILEASFILQLLDGNSVTDHPKWVKQKVDYNEINYKMPKKDRLLFRIEMKKKELHMLKKGLPILSKKG